MVASVGTFTILLRRPKYFLLNSGPCSSKKFQCAITAKKRSGVLLTLLICASRSIRWVSQVFLNQSFSVFNSITPASLSPFQMEISGLTILRLHSSFTLHSDRTWYGPRLSTHALIKKRQVSVKYSAEDGFLFRPKSLLFSSSECQFRSILCRIASVISRFDKSKG